MTTFDKQGKQMTFLQKFVTMKTADQVKMRNQLVFMRKFLDLKMKTFDKQGKQMTFLQKFVGLKTADQMKMKQQLVFMRKFLDAKLAALASEKPY